MAGGFSGEDLHWMDTALRLGARGAGRTRGNPPVGAVLVREGRCLGAGYHDWAGRSHAEMWALERAGDAASGATCYLTLEPCDHQGRTPPCSRALLRAGVARVVYGADDPSAHASGSGPATLTQGGVLVEGGCRREACEALAEAFLHAARSGRSLLIAKAACGPDGRLATHLGESRWLSDSTSRRLYRRLRARHDAVVIGSGTALRDDPHLGPGVPGEGPGPVAVVLDGALRLSPDSRLARRASEGDPVLVYTRPGPDLERRKALEARGVQVLEVPAGTAGRGVDLEAVARDLARQGLLSVLVEGGGLVLSDLFDRGMADRLLLFRVPRLVGGSAAPQLWSGRGVAHLASAPRLLDASTLSLDGDDVLEARLVAPGPPEKEPGGETAARDV